MRQCIFLLLTLTCSISTASDLCIANERNLFSCRLEANRKYVSLCQSNADNRKIIYRFGRLGQIEISLPNGGSPPPKTSHERIGPAITQWVEHIIFKNGEFLYVLSSLQGMSNSLNVYKGNRQIAEMNCEYQTEAGFRIVEVSELLSRLGFSAEKNFCSACPSAF